MAVYLSPGVFPREIDLSVLPTSVGPLRPAFVGTANKGPLNVATLITTSTQYIDTFGNPFTKSFLGYAVLAYLEEGNQCYVMRVAVECAEGQPTELDDVCIDTSGVRGQGWGRLPLFKGIDFGHINFREVTADSPLVFHDASVSSIDYNDVEVSNTFGATAATLNVTYSDSVDDSYIMIITSAPNISDNAPVSGAGYQIVRNSDGIIVSEGILDDPGDTGQSSFISVEDGLSIQVEVTSGVLDENDTFSFTVVPNNRNFTIAIEGDTSPTVYTMLAATYTDAATFTDAANALISGEDYIFTEHTLDDGETVIPQVRSTIAGDRIQLTGTVAFALECGSQAYAWDIPRSYLLGLDPGPYNITSQNNRVRINVIGQTETLDVEFNVPVGLNQTTASVAASIDTAGVVAGDILWDSFELQVSGGSTHVVIVVGSTHQFDTLLMLADFSNLKTLRFAEELNIPYPYTRAYRGFNDNRVLLPASGETTVSQPLSCEADPLSNECVADTAYFANIVGWLVAPSAGTWVDGLTLNLSAFTTGPLDAAGRYTLLIKGSQGESLEQVQDISFDKIDDRYIGNVINAGSTLGGTNGNPYANWEERPAYLNNNPSLDTYDVRQPSQFNNKVYTGQADGIPSDPAYSSELDAAVIGNPALSTGLYAFQNPEAIDINLLLTPGFSTGSVIGTALQVCEGRGDVLYIVDAPFGLRPQQVVDWHNGMLLSDLRTAINSSYGALYWSWLRVYDQFSRQEVWIPPSGHVSAVFSRTAREAETWFAPAGLRRGRLLTALDIEYSPTQGERDLLYGSGNAVNPIVKFPQDGITIWGQRTLQRTQTALDRVDVRMLLIGIKKNMTQVLRNFIFEPNDRALWDQVDNSISPYLADVQSRRGLTAYKVVVDETNNTPERIDRNELWVSIFLQPTKTVEFVVLNLVVLRTGASFSAEEVLAAGGIV